MIAAASFGHEFADRVRYALQKHERLEKSRAELLATPEGLVTLTRERQAQLEHDGLLFTGALQDLGQLLFEALAPDPEADSQ